jgi:hypothetical protein
MLTKFTTNVEITLIISRTLWTNFFKWWIPSLLLLVSGAKVSKNYFYLIRNQNFLFISKNGL